MYPSVGKVPLRDGAAKFLSEALGTGEFKIAVIAATASDPTDNVADTALLAALGPELKDKILMVGSQVWRDASEEEEEESDGMDINSQLQVALQRAKVGTS
jgi:hypothetical protein